MTKTTGSDKYFDYHPIEKLGPFLAENIISEM